MIRKSALKRGKPPKRKNVARRNREWARSFHSSERVEFVNSRRCVVNIFCCGPMQNMHTKGDGGSRRGSYKTIVPACFRHHDDAHHEGQQTFARRWKLDLEALADATQAAWLQHSGGTE